MATASRLFSNSVVGLQMTPLKVGGAYHKPLSGRKRAELVSTIHESIPKKWELREPKGIKHEASKIKRKQDIEKNLKSVARQMPDRIKKHPKREERVGHQWFKPSFEQTALKYFRKRSVSSITLSSHTPSYLAPSTIGELTLHLLRNSGLGVNVPPADKPKLLIQLENRAAGINTNKEAGGKDKKKKKK